MIRLRTLLTLVVAGSAVSCSSTTPPPSPMIEPPAPAAAPTTQAELEQLRAENARLRAQLGGVTRENATMRDRNATLEAKQESFDTGQLKPGLTVAETAKVVTGDAQIYKDTCQLVSSTDSEWVYRITDRPQVSGPGSGGAAPTGTNMRGEHASPAKAWVCTFDAHTGKLVAFHRDSE